MNNLIRFNRFFVRSMLAVGVIAGLSACGGSSDSEDVSHADPLVLGTNRSNAFRKVDNDVNGVITVDAGLYLESDPFVLVPVTASADTGEEVGSLQYEWTQLDGPEAFILNPNELSTDILMPDVDESTFLHFRFAATLEKTGGESITDSDTMSILVRPLLTSTLTVEGGMVEEATGEIVFKVTLNAPAESPLTLNFETVARSALAGSDFEPTTGELEFDVGELEKEVNVPVGDDEELDGDKYFALRVFDPLSSDSGFTPAFGFGVIVDDEAPGARVISDAPENLGESEIPQSDLSGNEGIVRVNFQWEGEENDLDLSVVDPCGNEISFGERQALCDEILGELDQDSADQGGLPEENILWADEAPVGQYQVNVMHFAGAPTDYTLRVFWGEESAVLTGQITNGEAIEAFHFSFGVASPSPTPDVIPTTDPTPTATPTASPTDEPSPDPTMEPSPDPTMEPTPEPDTVPDAFRFPSSAPQMPGTVVTSNAVTIRGIDAPAPIRLSEGEYSIDGGDFVSGEGGITNGQTIQVRTTVAEIDGTSYDLTVEIGGVVATFTIFVDMVEPVASIVFPPPNAYTQGTQLTVRGTASDNLSGISRVIVSNGFTEVEAEDISEAEDFSEWVAQIEIVENSEVPISVDAIDGAGNSSPEPLQVRILQSSRLDLVGTPGENHNRIESLGAMDLDIGNQRVVFIDPDNIAIYAYELTSGDVTFISDNSREILDFPLSEPDGILFDGEGAFYVTDGREGTVSVVTDAPSGERDEPFSSDSRPSDDQPFEFPGRLIFDPTLPTRMLVADNSAGIMAVELGIEGRGTRTLFSEMPLDPDSDGAPLGADLDLVADSDNNRILVTQNLFNQTSAIVSVDPITGNRTAFSDEETPETGLPSLANPRGIVIVNELNRAFVGNEGDAGIIAVDLDTGSREIISTAGVPNNNNQFTTIVDMVYDESLGYLIAVDPGDAEIAPVMYAVDPVTGERVALLVGSADAGAQ